LGQQTPMYNQHPIYEYDDEVDDENDSSEDESEEDMGDHEEDGSIYERNEDDRSNNMETKGINSILRIESTGPSLSIGTTSDATKNCTGQFIYFIAYYTTIPSTVSGMTEFIHLNIKAISRARAMRDKSLGKRATFLYIEGV